MSKEIDITALRKAAQEVITYADSRVPGWQLDELEDKQPRLQVVLPVPVTELVALLDRLEQAERDATNQRGRNHALQMAVVATQGDANRMREKLEQAEKEAELYRHVRELTKAAGHDSITEALVALGKAEKERDELKAGAFPMQPIHVAEDGCIRFKKNRIVDDMLEHGRKHGFGLNEMAMRDYTDDERMQLAQLIGYSVSGYGNLSYASEESVARADEAAEAILAAMQGEGT